MTKIGIISDTHGYLDEAVYKHFNACNEVWHAGDFGGKEIAEDLKAFKTLKGVYGNIDGYDIRSVYPQQLTWQCEEVTVYMTHIGGYPKRYSPGVKSQIKDNKAGLFICGHSHILKVIYDQEIECLHINPGAAGKQGWHKMRTLIRLTIDGANMKDCEIIELGTR